jgi:hypothetical protein
MLDQLASSSFQSDWGTRTVGADSAGFDPESYAKGSVFALGTTDVAAAYWSEHRPAVAQQAWNSLLPWFSLDSMGHLHEVLAGNLYRPQIESVPEQTWSSAGFLSSTVHGLLGLEVDSVARRIVFAPRLPATWNVVSIANLQLAEAPVGLVLRRNSDGLTLEIDNPAAPFHLEFSPEIPLGARLGKAEINRRPIPAELRSYPQETCGSMGIEVPHGHSELHLGFTEGVSIVAETPHPLIGDASTGLHLVSVSLANHVLTVVADVPGNRDSHIDLHTHWEIANAKGSTVRRIDPDSVEMSFPRQNTDSEFNAGYVRTTATVEFAAGH